VLDPYAKANERIRSRSRGRAADPQERDTDRLIRSASQDLGATVEAAVGLVFDAVERVGLRSLEDAARSGVLTDAAWAPRAVRGVRYASSRLPGSSGRMVSGFTAFVLRNGLTVVRELRERLESTRRDARSPGDGAVEGAPAPAPAPARERSGKARARRVKRPEKRVNRRSSGGE
jgi:hypothetical protein